MDKRQTGIIATVATALLCGCPGLLAFCWGVVAAVTSVIPGADININGNTAPQSALLAGISSLCVGALFIAIPVVVGVVMLRKKPETTPVSNEPLPPAS